MTLIITSVILCLITAIALGFNIRSRRWRMRPRMLLSLFWLLIIVLGTFTLIPANHVGIKYNPFNDGIQSRTLGEGFKAKSPFDRVYKLSTEVTKLEFQDVTVQTMDSQWVKTQLQVQVQIDKDKAFDYFKKYRDRSFNDISQVIQSTVQKELESVSTQYNIMEILGEKRDEIVNITFERVRDELIKDGIVVRRFILVDTEAGKTIEEAIAREAAAQKEAETAKWLKEKAELEGEALVIAAQKEKEANDLKTRSLTEAILREKTIEKWDGKLPMVTGGNNMIDISSLFK